MPKTVAKASAKTRTVAYDVAEQLRTPEKMAAYLDASQGGACAWRASACRAGLRFWIPCEPMGPNVSFRGAACDSP